MCPDSIFEYISLISILLRFKTRIAQSTSLAGGGKALPIDLDLADPNLGVGLAMALHLFILLFALQVEDQHFFRASLIHHGSQNLGGTWLAQVRILCAGGGGQHLSELDVAIYLR